MRYATDANILINFGIFLPFAYHKTFWNQLSEKVKEGEIIILDVIADECKRDTLKKWIEKQEIVKVDSPTKERALEINEKYGLITTDSMGRIKSAADPELIAFAEIHKCAVFSYEAKRRLDTKQPMKIPDVCEKLRVPCKRWPDKVFKSISFQNI